MMLSDGKFSPITGTIGFVEATPSDVANAFFEWQSPLFRKTSAPLQLKAEGSLDFEEAMNRLSTLTTRASRWIFLPAGEQHTAIFSNCYRGLDPTPISPLAVKWCGRRGWRVTAVKSSHRGKKYASRIVEVFSPASSNAFHSERSLYCANDGGEWKFGSSGDPYGFEDTSMLNSNQIKDRFSIEDLWGFMRHFQIEGNAETFYGNRGQKGYQVYMSGELPPNMKRYLLADLV